MTKETKIGLLVGLAFIILFAIILSEKGATRSGSAPTGLTVADASKQPTRIAAGERPFGGAGQVETPLGPIVTPHTPSHRTPMEERVPPTQPIGAENEQPPPLPASVVQMLNLSESGSNSSDGVPYAAGPEEPGRGEPLPAVSPEGMGPSQPPVSYASATTNQPGTPPPSASLDGVTPAASGTKAIHVVQPGESVGKIAAKHYGRSTPSRIEAIQEANRDVLKDPHKIKAGDKLKIPLIEQHGDQFELVGSFAGIPAVPQSATAGGTPRSTPTGSPPIRIPTSVEERTTAGENPREPAPRPESPRPANATGSPGEQPRWQWYEVQKKDTLSGIAKQRLGGERFANDIYNFNRDVLPNKNTLKPGMKIRIPLRNPAGPATATLRAT